MSLIPVVGPEVLRSLVGPDEALEAVTEAFRLLGEGRAVQPPPMGFTVGADGNEVHVKAAAIDGGRTFTVKIATSFADAPSGPRSSGLMVVLDGASGEPAAVLYDRSYLTDLRTGAAGALAVRLLAPSTFRRLLVVGTGTQARCQLEAIRRVRKWDETLVWGRSEASVAGFVGRVGFDADIRSFVGREKLGAAVAEADVVVTTTPSREPLIEATAVRDGATIIAVGSDAPEKRELESAVLASATRLVVDSLEQCAMLGELHHALCDRTLTREAVHAELGEIVVGRKPGRERADEHIVCDLTGVGAQDALIAEEAWRRVDLRAIREAPMISVDM